MRSALYKISAIVLIAAGGLSLYAYAQNQQWFNKPCSRPITYSLGSFDPKFGLTQDQFLADVNKAVQIWDQPLGKSLFEYSSNAQLKINLIYDARQAATDKLRSLGYTIDGTESSYNSLKAKYDSLQIQYQTLKQKLDVDIARYEQDRQAYETQVNYWNSQGGAPKKTVDQLNAQRDSLTAQAARINSEKDQVNSLVDQINALANALNRLGSELNLNVKTYNQVGQSRGGEFEEGLYKSDGKTREIDIYEFENQNQLVRVLAHELGHALGLQHIDSDPSAIMYYLNQGKNDKATVADLAALKQLCGLTP